MASLSLTPLIFIGLLVWIWLAGARARELAVLLARQLCERRGVQLLDESVGLRRLGIRWTDAGLRLRRMFVFDYSVEGVGRHQGYILLLGTQLELVDWDRSDGADGEAAKDPADADQAIEPPAEHKGTVVPFRRPGDKPNGGGYHRQRP